MKAERYQEVLARVGALVQGENDEIAVQATVVCELAHAFDCFDWVGFYRVVQPGLLKIGPYQGGHGCLVIPFSAGVCGKCAREKKTQLIADVNEIPYHIACSGSTRSEIVVPVLDQLGAVRAVLDVDSDEPGAFDRTDAEYLERLCRMLGAVYRSELDRERA
jgi:GAF domain-containing protein